MALGAVAATVLGVIFVLIFLDSGANRGLVTLRDSRSYPAGTVTHVPESGFFFVRLGNDLLALVDLDAANQGQAGRRCRVRAVGIGEGTAGSAAEYEASLSPEARGTTLVLAEDCNSAVYDIAGTRLDADGPNLDRFRVSLDRRGRVVVHTEDRECTRREGSELRLQRDCGPE